MAKGICQNAKVFVGKQKNISVEVIKMMGIRHENLVVVNVLKGSFVECLCDCGSKKIIRKGHFNAGYYKSCGCHVERHGHNCKDKK